MSNFPIRPAWTPLSITLMVVGFIVFWPLGLAMLGWIIWGERLESWWAENRHRVKAGRPVDASGNEAFEEYRRAELDRLERERRRIEEEAAEFQTFLRELRMKRDREEFDRFMAERRNRVGSESHSVTQSEGTVGATA